MIKKPKELPRVIRDIELFVTEKCNSSCLYCYHTQKPREMTDEIMEGVIRTFKDKWDENVLFTFFGGEPLLRIDFLSKWASRLIKEVPKCKLALSTNGTILNKDFAQFWKNFPRSTFQISYDGVCQEKNRGNAELVRNNIKDYLAILGDKVQVRSTYLRQDVGTLYDTVIDCYNLGFKRLYAQPAMNSDAAFWSKEDFAVYKTQVDKIYQFLDEHKDAGMNPYDSEILLKRDECRQCGMGRTILAVDAGGDVYPCHRLTSVNKFKLGNVLDTVNRGYFLTLIPHIKCETCASRAFCSPCLVANYTINGSLRESASYICKIGYIDYMTAQTIHNETYKNVYTKEQMILAMVHVLEDVKKGNSKIIRKLSCLKY